MNKRTPTEIRRLEDGMQLTWSDGQAQHYSGELLRKFCPCATCKEQRGDESHAKPLTGGRALLKVIEHTKEEQVKLIKIAAVGNYAIGLEWADGHSSGIYTYDYLASLTAR